MRPAEGETWFVGDLGDPWVAAIAARLPEAVRRRDCPGEIPEAWTVEEPPPRLVVLHRVLLTATDLQRVTSLRARGEPPPRVILCVGPLARYDDLARGSRLFDVVLPEATAAETIRRHVEPRAKPAIRRPVVHVISGLHDARTLLGECCRYAGYAFVTRPDSPEECPSGLVVWEIPALDPLWPERLARRARAASVIGLIGFADRALVSIARDAGAAACLDWPCDIDDLAHVLDRTSASIRGPQADPSHVVPPTPALLRRAVTGEGVEPRRSS